MVCPEEVRIFTCEARGSNSLAWESEQYIGEIPLSLSRVSSLEVISPINPNISARLIRNYVINEVRVLRSELRIVVSPAILDDINHMITCVNIGFNTKDNFTLYLAQDGMTLHSKLSMMCFVSVEPNHAT